ncbi:hypothetical protein WJX74_008324 [Apatococcus lobatus]|uniref:phenylalanine--tRNA ligase n=1 Tax=Apatococcus lobatus TaxID=904363 RepID=A0AAW1QTL9_9CHLO
MDGALRAARTLLGARHHRHCCSFQRSLGLQVQCLHGLQPAKHTLSPSTRGRTIHHSSTLQHASEPLRAVSRSDVMTDSPVNNVPENIFGKIGTDLHLKPNHPLCIIKSAIYDYFEKNYPGTFKTFDDRKPVVTLNANFDSILIPEDHISRSSNDTFYVDNVTCLRCHTSAHQAELLREGQAAFLCTGDVYRRDTIDSTHYPVFHQMEGLRVFESHEWSGQDGTDFCLSDLKKVLEGLAKHLFGDVQMRWVEAYFPFTDPSLELEIFFRDEWLEVLGSGVVQQEILQKNYTASGDVRGWAFGLGLERLAMVLFQIPDIRLFWTADTRFLKQFKQGDLTTRFKPYSKFPPVFKDVAFWTSSAYTENNLCEIVRTVAGDLVEETKLIDDFTHPKTGRTSHCYRIAYRSPDRSMTDEEINQLQDEVRSSLQEKLEVQLR